MNELGPLSNRNESSLLPLDPASGSKMCVVRSPPPPPTPITDVFMPGVIVDPDLPDLRSHVDLFRVVVVSFNTWPPPRGPEPPPSLRTQAGSPLRARLSSPPCVYNVKISGDGEDAWRQRTSTYRVGSRILVRGAQRSFDQRGLWAQNLLEIGGFP